MAYKRYLLLLSLAVLCIVSMSAAGLAADSWAVKGADLPTAMVWDQSRSSSVQATNDGTTTWDTTYDLRSVQGITGAATALDRWGVPAVQVVGTVAPLADTTFAFDVIAPPITTIKYNTPITATSVPVITGFDDNYMVANVATLITTDTAAAKTKITRFTDVPGSYWAAAQIEECAGRVPFVVQGFGGGLYGPAQLVARDQMAAFIQRAAQLPTAANTGQFVDVPAGFWAQGQIYALLAHGITGGTTPTTYSPGAPVSRSQMAAFLARTLCNGDTNVPSGPPTATFTDVPLGNWAYNYVEYAVAHAITQGTAPGLYSPNANVPRDQMAVFVYRAFIQPTDVIVVLAGPGLTKSMTSSYDGWSSASVADPDLTAYVGFDAVRFGATQPNFDVKFQLYAFGDIGANGLPNAGATPAAETTVTVNVAAAKAAATGDKPYAYASWDLSTVTAADGKYTLLTTVNNSLLARELDLWIGPVPPPQSIAAAWGNALVLADQGGIVGDRTVVAGSLESSMAALDGVSFQTQRNSYPVEDGTSGNSTADSVWCDWNMGDSIVFHGVDPAATTLSLTLTYNCNTVDGWALACCGDAHKWGTGLNGNGENCCDSWGVLDPAWPGHTPVYTADNGVSVQGNGLRVMSSPSGVNNWQTQWYDNTGTDTNGDGDDDVWALDGSGDPNKPADNDVQGGGAMYSHIGFTGDPTTLTTFQWGTYNAPAYITADGDVVVVLCGGSWQYTNIDQAVLTVGFDIQ